jgi:hypothetical protein
MPFDHDPNDTCPFDSWTEYNAAMAEVYGPDYRAVTEMGFSQLKAQSDCGSELPTPAQREARAEDIRESIREARPPASAERRRRRRAEMDMARARAGAAATEWSPVPIPSYPPAPTAAKLGTTGLVVATVVAAGVMGWLLWRN